MKRRWIPLLVFVLAVGVLSSILRERTALDRVIEQELQLRELVRSYPLSAWAVGLVIYIVSSLIPGTFGKAVVFGWLYGFWAGLALVNFGLTLAAMVIFGGVRGVFPDFARAKFGRLVRGLDRALARDGPVYLLSLRLIGAPYWVTNCVAAATAVPAGTFFWTTQMGLIPGNAALVLAGSRLPSLRELADRNLWCLVDAPLLIGLSVAALLPLLVRRILRRRKWVDEDLQEL